MARRSHIKGLDKWDKWADKVPQEVEQKVEEHVEKTAYKIEADAKRLAPVREVAGGTLRRSIKTKFTGTGKDKMATIGTNVKYARYVEFGTSKMNAQPFLIPAFIMHRTNFEIKLKRIIKEGLR